MKTISKNVKRPLSLNSSTSTDISDDLVTHVPQQESKPKVRSKKIRKQDPGLTVRERLEDQLGPVKGKLLSEADSYVLSYVQLESFIDRAKGHPNIAELSLEFTADTQALIKMLEDNYPLLSNRSIKNRFTRIIRKLATKNSNESVEMVSDTSEEEFMSMDASERNQLT